MFIDKDRLLSYYYNNVASVFWSLFLVFGAVVFVAYYIHIEYMPDFDMMSSISLLAAVSATSIFFIVFLVLMGIMPGLFWDYYWSDMGGSSNLSQQWKKLETRDTIQALMIWFALPILAIFASVIGELFFGWYSFIFLVIVAFGFFGYLVTRSDYGFWEGCKNFISLAFASFMTSVFAFFPFYFIIKASEMKSDDNDMLLFLIALLSLFVVFMNVFVAAPITSSQLSLNNIKKNKIIKNTIIGALVLVVICIWSKATHLIPESVMRLYKFGAIHASKIVFDKEGCDVLGNLYLKGNPEEGMCYVDDVLILSRLGNEYYLQMAQGALIKSRYSDSKNHENEERGEVKTGAKAGAEADKIEARLSSDTIRFTISADRIVSWATSSSVNEP